MLCADWLFFNVICRLGWVRIFAVCHGSRMSIQILFIHVATISVIQKKRLHSLVTWIYGIIFYMSIYLLTYLLFCAFSALTLLVGCQEEHLACKNWLLRCWCGYLSGARCILFAYGPADVIAIWKPHHPASFKSRLVVPFWYRLMQVVLEKRPLMGVVVVVVVVLISFIVKL